MPMELRGLQRSVAEAVIVSLVGVVLALIGAFGTAALPLGVRFAYWIGGFLAAGIVLQFLVLATGRIASLLRLPDYAPYALAVPLLAVLIFVTLDHFALGFGQLGSALYFQILAVGCGFFVLFGAIHVFAARQHGDPEPVSGQRLIYRVDNEARGVGDTSLHQLLPTAFPPIVALSSEDHYVRVHASNRSELILMNLADAIAKMGETSGLRTHRSWWVARNAVLLSKRTGRNATLLLVGEIEVPISRGKLNAVRSAGLLN